MCVSLAVCMYEDEERINLMISCCINHIVRVSIGASLLLTAHMYAETQRLVRTNLSKHHRRAIQST